MIITDVYEEDGKTYWPDTLVGSVLDYGIDWSDWLTNENDTFVSITWAALPTGLSSDYESDADDISLIRLSADAAGTHCISGIMECIESGHEQSLPVQMYLIVAELC
jgi:hypothetical protein